MKVRLISCITFLTGTILTSCASVQTELPEILPQTLSEERLTQETLAFDNIETLTQRLMRVSAPILRENSALCPKVKMDIGVSAHRLKSYSKHTRSAAARELGAREDISIYNVRPDSTADKAGLKRGDNLIDANDKVVSPNSKKFQRLLKSSDSHNLQKQIRVRREGRDFMVFVTPEEVCDYAVTLSPTTTVNAYATGKKIIMTAGMMEFVKDDNELALIIGHELAHNTMGHIRKSITNFILSLGGTRYTRPFESEADYVGMYYMARAGYNISNVEDFWRRLAISSPKSVVRAKTHPTTPSRYLHIAASREEIQAKQAASTALLPNFKVKN